MKTQYDDIQMTGTEKSIIDKIATALLSNSDASRSDAARIVREHGLAAYVGGHHVAIHRESPEWGSIVPGRLALVTSDTPDWN